MYVYGTEYYLVAFSGLLTYPATCFVFLPFFHNLGLTSAYQVSQLLYTYKALKLICYLVYFYLHFCITEILKTKLMYNLSSTLNSVSIDGLGA